MNSSMKKSITGLLLIAAWGMIIHTSTAQEITQELRTFNKIVASPKINLILEKGEQESIRLVYNDIEQDQINIEVKGKTLRIYLDDSRITERTELFHSRERRSLYQAASITAYVTYTELRHLEIRGQQELTCHGPLEARKFKLKAYGENEITLASIRTDRLKTSLYGENRVKISGGKVAYQKFKLFGENKIDCRELKNYATTATLYGESKIKLNTQDELRVTSFGESQVSYRGEAEVSRGLIFGSTTITRMN